MVLCLHVKSGNNANIMDAYQSSVPGQEQSVIGWNPPEPEDLTLQLPGYEFQALLGSGGMGAVYKAHHLNLDRPVAIKVLPYNIARLDTKFTDQFKREARTMAKLSHPGIVSVYDAGVTDSGFLYFVMEYVEGTDVSQMLLIKKRLPAGHALAITAHVCDALSYAHSHGVVHRDIKPANIMVSQEGRVKVADFGLARFSTDSGEEGAVVTMGTPYFVAPEALTIGMSVDHRADVYALGVMLYDMLTGEIPRDDFQPSSVLTGCDPRFDKIIHKAMQVDVRLRFQSVDEMRTALNEILTGPLQKAIPVSEKIHVVPQRRSAAHHAIRAGRGSNEFSRPVRPAIKSSGQHRRPEIIQHSQTKNYLAKLVLAVLVVGGMAAIWQSMITQAGGSSREQAPGLSFEQSGSAGASVKMDEVKELPEAIVEFSGSRYQFIRQELTWQEARKKAEEMGGHLAVLTSDAENEWVKNTFLIPFNRDGGFWLGAVSQGHNNWKWVTGELWDFTLWARNEPNYEGKTDRWYLAMAQRQGGWDRGWHDSVGIRNHSRKPSLVEWSVSGKAAIATGDRDQQNNAPLAGAKGVEKRQDAESSIPDVIALQQKMQQLTEERVERVYQSALHDLNKKYEGALAREITLTSHKMTHAALIDDLNLIKANQRIPEQDQAGLPDRLKALRAVYRNSAGSIEAARQRNLTLLEQQYHTALLQLESRLANEDRNKEAAVVRNLMLSKHDNIR